MATQTDGVCGDFASRVPSFGSPPRRAASSYLLPLNFLEDHPLGNLVLDLQRNQAPGQSLAKDDFSDVIRAS